MESLEKMAIEVDSSSDVGGDKKGSSEPVPACCSTTHPCCGDEHPEGQEDSKNNRCKYNTRQAWRCLGPYVVSLLCMFAAGFTFIASWSCNTFYGAEMPWIVGGGYGIWSLQDSHHNCQLWSVLFFAYDLDAPLRAARFFSMTAMLCSLAAIAILTQIIAWGRIGSWIVAIALIYWLAESISYWWRFNIWSTFFILTYFLMVLVVKCFLLERCSSPQTLWRVARCLFAVCCLGSAGIFFVLASNVCMCEELTPKQLENHKMLNSTYHRPADCSGMCVLGPTSHTAIATPFLWVAAWMVSQLVLPSQFSNVTGNEAAAAAQEAPGNEQVTTMVGEFPEQSGALVDAEYRDHGDHVPRPRLGTAATLGTSEDGGEEEEWRNRQGKAASGSKPTMEEDTGSAMAIDANPYKQEISARSSTITEPLTASQIDETSEIVSTWTATKDYDAEDRDHPAADKDSSNDMFWQSDSSDSTIATATNHPKRKPPRWRRVEHCALVLVVALYLFVVVVLLGSFFENKNAGKAPDTSFNFITNVVCAFHPLDPGRPFETFANKTLAEEAGYVVAHCGECGKCSNPSDIEIYVETRTTVAASSKKCSKQAIFGKEEDLTDCLEKEIGFSRPCTTCWVEDMRNTAKHCMWTCLSSMLIGISSSNNVADAKDYYWLNQCVFCDEKQSGPDFVTCSGVARRRLGIQSEFERNPLEQCPNVGFDYLTSNLTQVFG